MNLKDKAKQLKTDIPAVFLAIKHKETPLLAKIVAVLAVGYILSPIDLIPDFIPVLGLLDDIIIVPALIVLFLKLIPANVFEECRKEAVNLWAKGKPKRWYYALPVIFVWLLLIFFIIRIII